jgi:D-glycero-D-manno-heptose 1,7-bisphosphate phosphatase
MGPQKVIFLDRDGVINVEHPQGYVCTIADWQLTPRVSEGLQLLQEQGFTLAVITNQSGIAYGLYTTADMRKVHEHMLTELEKKGVTIAAIAFCPHDRDSTCDCRKPQPGMAKHIEEQVGAIDYPNSWMIGDKIADQQFGHNIGTKTVLIKSSFWTPKDLTNEPTLIADSLYEAAQKIVSM